jgi:Flp pilus assembly CpaF family ATPase
VPGIYEIGSGKSTNLNVLAEYCAELWDSNINYVTMPDDLVLQYQKHTCAKLVPLRSVGYKEDF